MLKARLAQFADSPAAVSVDAAENAVDQRVALAQSEYDNELAGLSPDGDTAQELRNSRIWERQRRVLDAAPKR
jgi:hypothetical protein